MCVYLCSRDSHSLTVLARGLHVTTDVVILSIFCRSKDFRPAYDRLHEIRALVPQGTPYLACTATVTRSIQEEVVKSLEMSGCEYISTSPDRPNIFYEVRARSAIEEDMQTVLESLKVCKAKAPRVVIYCQSLNTCADLYAHFHYELGDDGYIPAGAAQISDNRIFAVFHANTPTHIKELVLKSITEQDGIVRVVFATVALGMGVNLHSTNTTIHYGGPQSLDDYFQESGRAGRSGDNARSIVYWKPADCPLRKQLISTRDHEVASVRLYLENTTVCRRKWLLDHFDPLCAKPGIDPSMCCDVCANITET